MSTLTSPVVAAWELALRLRRRREQVGIEVKTITQTLGFTRNYWSAVENERKILSEESLLRIVELFEFDREERQELIELRATAKEHGWWVRYSGLINDDLQRLYGLEYGAQSVRTYENLLLPGLLQTAEYARAIMTPDVTVRQVEVDQLIEARLRRQERFTGESPLQLTALISEAALRQQIGGPEVLRQQLEHVVDMLVEHPDHLEVRVIPFTATACGLFGAATVHLIDFDSPRLPTVAWQETVTTQGIIDDPTQVRDLTMTYNDAFRHALTKQESLAFIRHRIEELA
ncbi:Scr1 family TA system antitoxin-like transcriptional regulator [Amycolatopsis sp. NPDC059021]|uniref:Scr1 family TA system antitoxin-like transcriptional regulator n=1 Tax=Amycolatopsis sp. NPDC059021 TaxID=3346704 RepID=UPI003672164D